MDVNEVLSAALKAAEAAVEIIPPNAEDDEEQARFNIDTMNAELLGADVPIQVVARGSLISELEVVRAERSAQVVKREKAEDLPAAEFHSRMVRALSMREEEIVTTLWPPKP